MSNCLSLPVTLPVYDRPTVAPYYAFIVKGGGSGGAGGSGGGGGGGGGGGTAG